MKQITPGKINMWVSGFATGALIHSILQGDLIWALILVVLIIYNLYLGIKY